MIHNEHAIQRPFAVVTEAHEWFGCELAHQFASKGFDLIITAKSEEVHEVKEDLARFGVFIESHVFDLSTYKGVEGLYGAIKTFGHPLDAICITTQEGPTGSFIKDTSLKDEIELIRGNVMAPIHLMKRVLKDMVKRGHGRVLISSPLNEGTEAPFEAVYSGTRSFLFSFTESIRSEMRNSGVTLTTMLPNLYDLPSEAELKAINDPQEMAREGFDALMAGRDYVFEATLKNKIQGMFGRLLPDKARAFIVGPS